MESESLTQKSNEEETGFTTVIAQAEGMEKINGCRGVGVGIVVPGVVEC